MTAKKKKNTFYANNNYELEYGVLDKAYHY